MRTCWNPHSKGFPACARNYTREYLIKLVRQYIPATHCNKVVHDKRNNQASSKHGEPGFSPIHQRMTISYLSTGNPHTPGKVRPYPLNDMILELALIDSQQ
jgi:hypothetical protein